MDEVDADLFVPVAAVARLPARSTTPGIAPVTEAVGVGFSGARRTYASIRDAAGRVMFSVTAVVLPAPLEHGSPSVFWPGRDFYYRLPLADGADSLHDWVSDKKTKRRFDGVFDDFNESVENHVVPSRKQRTAVDADVSIQELFEQHDTDMMWSSAYALAFCLVQNSSSKKSFKIAGLDLLSKFSSLVPGQNAVLEDPGDEMPVCHLGPAAFGECSHVKQLVYTMKKKFGESWTANNIAEFLWTSAGRKCIVVDEWRSRAFWQLADDLDKIAIEEKLNNRPDDVTVFKGRSRTSSPHGLYDGVAKPELR